MYIKYSREGLRVIFKRTMIMACLAFIAVLIWGYMRDNAEVKLYEGLDANSITSVAIYTPYGGFKTNDKSKIIEIANDLKKLSFYKDPNLMPPNDTPDAWIVLKGKNDVTIDSVVIYGHLATRDKDENKYEFNYTKLDELYKKYK